MCGILGAYSPRLSGFDPALLEARLEEGLKALAHRGPDASRARVWPEHGLALGHRRLSILDLSERANQPMASPDGTVLVVYNGEIYNFRELRAELEKGGHSFSTTSDTEVLIRGYQVWDLEGLLERAAGMFAFALYDAKARKLWLVRDRPGKKPLYYAQRAGSTYFSSELRGLLKVWPGPREISREGLEAFLTLKFCPSPLTLVDGVKKVPPGHYLEVNGNGTKLIRYWSPLRKQAAAAERLEDLIEERLSTAVRRRLVSDVPVCVFLSGGIDSSLIVHKLAESGAKGMATYTVGYGALPGYSEFEYSRMIAKRYPIDYREVTVTVSETLDALEDPALVLDDPVTDWAWVPLHFLSRRARADGFKVVLLGEGSDELFFGYDVMAKGLRDLERFGEPLWRALAAAGYFLGSPVYDVSRKGHRRYDLWRRAALGLPVYWGSSIGFPRTQRHQVAGPALGPEGKDPAGEFVAGLYARYRDEAADPSDLANLVSFVEFSTKMTEVLLHRVDRVSMLHSLEARAPFLDHELCELAFSIPGGRKIPGGRLKGLLKDFASRHLPSEIVTRPKMGFSFPFKEWLRGPLGPAAEDAFERSRLFRDHWLNATFCRRLLAEHRSGWTDHAPRLWMLYSLARWYDRWIR